MLQNELWTILLWVGVWGIIDTVMDKYFPKGRENESMRVVVFAVFALFALMMLILRRDRVRAVSPKLS